jgi:hypothetical protein
MTWHEAFTAYQGSDRRGERGVFPMSMVGGNPAARVLNNEYQQRLTGETPEGAKPPSLKDFNRAQELVQREQALTDRWLRAHGIEDLNDPQAARELMMRRTEAAIPNSERFYAVSAIDLIIKNCKLLAWQGFQGYPFLNLELLEQKTSILVHLRIRMLNDAAKMYRGTRVSLT